jgi:hypothetical protein
MAPAAIIDIPLPAPAATYAKPYQAGPHDRTYRGLFRGKLDKEAEEDKKGYPAAKVHLHSVADCSDG